MPNKNKVSLGFTDQQFDPGIHICQIYGDNEEHYEALMNFILSGLKAGECTSCFTEKISKTEISEFLEKNNLTLDSHINSGGFILSGASEIYFQNGCFDPDKMLSLLINFYNESLVKGFSGSRVIGEMSPQVLTLPGGDRLMEYEKRVSTLLKEYPITAVCQYDARAFEGATILDILRVHPFVLMKGSVIVNPFYVEPDNSIQHEC